MVAEIKEPNTNSFGLGKNNLETPLQEEARKERGFQIFKTKTIMKDRKKHGLIVPSQTSSKKYFVTEDYECDCPDYQFRGQICKHGYAVKYFLQVERQTPKGVEKTKLRLTYPQAWKAYNEAQKTEIREFDKLLSDLVECIEEPEQRMGRPRLSLREQVFCSVQKVYSQLSSRRAYSLFKNAEAKEQIGKAPNYNAINKLLNRKDVTPVLNNLVYVTAQPLQSVETEFAIDSSGFRTTKFGEYCKTKHNTQKQHRWLKAHICVGVKTNVITGIEVTKENAHDSPQFESLVRITSQNGFSINEVTADKAYSSKKNLQIVDNLGGVPYIPFKANAKATANKKRLWKKLYHYFQLNQEEFMEYYHKRSNAETTFHMIKTKFGDTLKSKKFTAQKNELLCKVIAHNIVVLIHETHELGIKPEFTM
jgi:transposase